MTMVNDLRLDQYHGDRRNPMWWSSKLFAWDDGAGMDDNETVLFMLDQEHLFRIDAALIEVSEAFNGTPTMTIGNGTVPTKNSTDGATVTVIDADSIGTNAAIAPTATGLKDLQSVVGAVPLVVRGQGDAAIPVIYVTLTATGTVSAGKARLHMQVSIVDENII